MYFDIFKILLFICKLFWCKSDKPVLISINPKGIYRCNSYVYSQVKLKSINQKWIGDVSRNYELLRKHILSEHFRKENPISLAFINWLENPNSLWHLTFWYILREQCSISRKQVAFRHEAKMLSTIKFFHSLDPHAKIIFSSEFQWSWKVIHSLMLC